MENKTEEMDAEIMLKEAKKGLYKKAGLFMALMVVSFAIYKVMDSDASLADQFGFSLAMALGFYLPFKIGYRISGSIFAGIFLGVILIVIILIIVGEHGSWLTVILLGGFAIDFGSSIHDIIKAKRNTNKYITK